MAATILMRGNDLPVDEMAPRGKFNNSKAPWTGLAFRPTEDRGVIVSGITPRLSVFLQLQRACLAKR